MNTLTQISVPFHGSELLIVEYNGQPYTPMKPIVESMGLDWKSQYRKLTAGYGQNDHTLNRWGITKIVIPTLGDLQEMVCLPLRKLFGWFNSISPNKVKPELRDKVIMYQNECDDVLWDYWTKGQAINERKTISADDLVILEIMVDEIAQSDEKVQKNLWRRFTKHFNIHHPQDLLSIHYLDAVRYIKQQEIDHKNQQIPLLPVPFKKGRFLVVCDGEHLTIHDVADYQCIKKDAMQKFQQDWQKAYREMVGIATDLFIGGSNIQRQDEQLPVLIKLSRY